MTKSKIIHLIPYRGIGGVERAAATIEKKSTDDFEFYVDTIFKDKSLQDNFFLFSPIYYIRCLLRLLRAHPNVLIVSLWRAYAVGILLKILRPRLRLVIFLHYPRDVHLLDWLFTRMCKVVAFKVWADSKETLISRLPGLKLDKAHVVSFVTDHIQSIPVKKVRPIFIFWGRIHAQKGLIRALKIFAGIKCRYPVARFLIIGPNSGDLLNIQRELLDLGLTDCVQILGPKSFAEIKQLACEASFYLQTSELEGMAMSVVEAMQLGLVPVVTPVGEIKHYACQGKNAILVSDDSKTIEYIFELLENNEQYQTVREMAITTWKHKLLYKNSVLLGCRELI